MSRAEADMQMHVALPLHRVKPVFVARVARGLRILASLRGWRGLVNRLVPEHAAPFTISNGGVRFAGNFASYIDRQMYLFGGYEATSIRLFLETVPLERRGTVLDIGANAGTHSLQFAQAFQHVHAFEPNPMLWAQFETNCELNELHNVQLHKVGLGDCDTELSLQLIDKPNYGLGTFTTAEQYDMPLRPVATCPVRHAGHYVQRLDVQSIDAVKIDVQGFEPQVLRGLAEVLRRDQPLIWCEIGEGTATAIATLADLAACIPFAFRCYRFTSKQRLFNRVVLHECTGALAAGDYLLVPTSWPS